MYGGGGGRGGEYYHVSTSGVGQPPLELSQRTTKPGDAAPNLLPAEVFPRTIGQVSRSGGGSGQAGAVDVRQVVMPGLWSSNPWAEAGEGQQAPSLALRMAKAQVVFAAHSAQQDAVVVLAQLK